jgi:hypothetical protein
MRLVSLILPAIFLMAAVPRLSPAPPGTLVNQVSAPLRRAGAFTIVASRQARGTAGLFQYYLSIYAAWPGAAWHLVYASDDGLIPDVVQGQGTARFFPDQTLKLLGVISFGGGAPPLAVAEMHNEAADCGEGSVMLLGPIARHAFGPVAILRNPCALTAKIAGSYIVLTGPYYAKGARLYKPTSVKAVAILRYRAGQWFETPHYFKITSRPERQPAPP